MSYSISLHKYHTTKTPQKRALSARDGSAQALIIGCVGIVVFLFALYVIEANALMFLQRTVPAKEKIIFEAKNDLQRLEIQTTQLRSSEMVQKEALAKEMVSLNAVGYVQAHDTSVALAKTGATQ